MSLNLPKATKVFTTIVLLLFTLSALCENSKDYQYRMALLMPNVDEFAGLSGKYAQAVADDLNIELITIDSSMGLESVIKQLEKLCETGLNGIIFHSGGIDGEKILQLSEKCKVPSFLINVNIKDIDFYPRTKYKYWIGKFLPDDQQAGAVLVEQLTSEAQKGGEENFHLLAIEGEHNDLASIQRVKGLKKYLQYMPNIESLKVESADWKAERAKEIFRESYRQNPLINIVWAANDSMAVAVADEIKKLKIKKKIYIGGVNWDQKAVQAVKDRDIQVTVGGHFLEASWGIILTHDFLKGKDFAPEGLSFRTKMLAVSEEKSQELLNFLATPPKNLDFTKLSKVTNLSLSNYILNFNEIVRAISKQANFGVINFTEEEKKWIKNNPVIRTTVDREWEPIEFIDETGKISGISADYLAIIEKKTGLKFSYSKDLTWVETLKELQEGKSWLGSAMVETVQRQEFADFTRPYLSFPTVLVTDKSVSYIGKMNELNGKKVSLVEGYAIQDILEKNYPKIILDKKPTTREALEAVSDGRCYAFMGDLPTVSELMYKSGFSNMKISGKCPYDYDISMAINKKHPILRKIIEKTLDSITEDEKAAIYDKWMNVTYEHKTSLAVIIKIIVIATIVILMILFWVQRLYLLSKKLSEAKNAAEKAQRTAEKASRVKSQFLANMSHEIRNPVNIILGFTQLLENRLSDKQNIRYLQSIKSAEKSLLQLTSDILDLSRMEASKLKLAPSDVDLKQLFKEVKHILIEKAEEKGLEAKIEIDQSIPNHSKIDEGRLKQILFNLITNAVKFTKSGYIQLSVIKTDSNKTGYFGLEITIKDTGIGIQKSEQDKIFNIFEQQTGSEDEEYGGAGLGLAICKRLTEMMRGQISLQSSLGLGSTFIVTLPNIKIAKKVILEEDQNEELSKISNSSLKSKVILVVDDIEANRILLREYMELLGATVIEAADGEEAVEKSKKIEFDLILMDIRLPKMNGFEAAKEIKKQFDIPIIALSGAIGNDEICGSNSTFNAFLSKPVNRNKLVNQVCHHIKVNKKTERESLKNTEGKDQEPPKSEYDDILAQLNSVVQPLWDAANISKLPKDITLFAKRINLLGEQYSQNNLVEFGTHLLKAVEDGDTKRVTLFIEQYSKVVDYFEKKAKLEKK